MSSIITSLCDGAYLHACLVWCTAERQSSEGWS